MSSADQSHQAFHQGTAPFFAVLSRNQIQQIADLPGDTTIAVRAAALAEKASEGELSEIERAEYEAYIAANNLLAVLQAEARFRRARDES